MTATPKHAPGRNGTSAPPVTRVAAYTRKSVTHGLDQEFTSIDAQRQAVAAFVESQRGAGWTTIPTQYDDGGFTGANTDRPAFQRLVADIRAGRVDCVGVYRIDRLSRSFADYVAILRLFEDHGVTFFSVSEQFNTTTPVGRLVLNQLVLFSQFEREVIAERIRDKARASRRRGQWTGGRPVLGYQVVEKKLEVDENEAAQVRQTFELYVEVGSLRATVAELDRRGWRNKSFTNKAGRRVEGRSFTKATLYTLLTNQVYRGKLRCGDELVDGVHEAIVDQDVWDAVQARLQANGNGTRVRNKAGAILRGLVRCGRCGSSMVHTFTTKARRRYRYYVCRRLHDQGTDACPGARVPAGEFEACVVGQLRAMGQDEPLLAATAAAVREAATKKRDELAAECRRAEQERRRLADERDELLHAVPSANGRSAPLLARVEELDDRLGLLVARLGEVESEIAALGNEAMDEADLRDALAAFQPIWDQLFPQEQERVLRLLVERVTYHPDTKDVEIDLWQCGIAALAKEAREQACD